MAQKTMYPAINNSPATSMIDAVSSVATSINLESAAYLPDAPNIATIGSDDGAELVLYTTKSANSIGGLTRGFNGTTAKAWPIGTVVYRAFTSYDHDAFKSNIEDLQANKLSPVTGATANNFAALNAQGKPIDSGKKPGDFATFGQGNKADSAVQNVKLGGTTLTKDGAKAVDIPVNQAGGVVKLDEQGLVPGEFIPGTAADRALWCQSLFHATGKIYAVSYDNTTMANVGTREQDAVGMVANPSTDAVRGANDFDSVPIFHSYRANGYVDESGEFMITAVEGEPNFALDGSNGDVWVLFKTCFFKIEMGDTDRFMVSDEPHGEGWFPTPGAIRPDGTLRPFIAIAAYRTSLDADGVPVSVSGKSPQYNVSHNNQITTMRKKGDQYCGQTSKDLFHLTTLMTIEYATRNEKSITYGCLSYSFQYAAAVTETGVERFIVTASQAANVIVGSCVSVGNPSSLSSGNPNIDRGNSSMHSKANRVKVTGKETLDGGNVAIYLDNGGTAFDTTAGSFTVSGETYNAPTYLSSMPWWTGSTDSVLGPTGSPGNLTNGKYDMRYRYVETVWGNQYVVLSDEVRKGDKVYTCYDCTKFATSLTDDYEEVGYSLEFTKVGSWVYVSKLGFDPVHPSVMEATECNANSTTGYCCGRYISDNTTSLFAAWAGCILSYVAFGGPRARSLYDTVASSWWNSASRLSATGRCGRVAGAA